MIISVYYCMWFSIMIAINITYHYYNSNWEKYCRYELAPFVTSKTICKRYYVEVILKETGMMDSQPSTSYSKSQKIKDEIIFDNLEVAKKTKFDYYGERYSLPNHVLDSKNA